MTAATLLLAAAVSLGVAAAYAHVARRVAARSGTGTAAGRAMGGFALWWGSLAVNIGVGAGFMVAAAAGITDPGLQLTFAILQRLLLAAGLAGLMGYLLFLLTGRDRLMGAAVAYLGFYAFLLFALFSAQPSGVYVGSWRTDVAYAGAAPGWVQAVNFVALVAPPIGGALAYFRLFFRLRDASQRYRIALVSWALIAWWVVAVVAGQREAFGVEWFQLVNRLVGLGAALVILAAFEPPRWVMRRYGIRPFRDAPGPVPEAA